MDPLTAFGLASTAFSAIKTAFEHGREIESMVSDIGRWTNAVYDFDAEHKKEKSKKGIYSSVEEQALESFIYKKKLEEQENDLRNMLNMRFGPNAWQQVLDIQKNIRKQRAIARQQAQEAHEEMMRNILLMVLIGLPSLFVLAIVATVILEGI